MKRLLLSVCDSPFVVALEVAVTAWIVLHVFGVIHL